MTYAPVKPSRSNQYCAVTADDHQIVRDGLKIAQQQPGLICTLLDTEVNGMFSKGAALDELYKQLLLIFHGGKYIADVFTESIEQQQHKQTPTDRQQQTLNMIVAGRTSREIAESISVSPKTVDKHRSSLMKNSTHTLSPSLSFMRFEKT